MGGDVKPIYSDKGVLEELGIDTNNLYDDNNAFSSSFFDKTIIGDNGNPIKIGGWGLPAGNLLFQGLGLLNNMNARDELLDQRKEELEFGKQKYFQNLAMKLANYRQFQNDRSKASAYRRWANAGREGNNFDYSPWENQGVIKNEFGDTVADPIDISAGSRYGVNVPAQQNAVKTPSPLWNQGAQAQGVVQPMQPQEPLQSQTQRIRRTAGQSSFAQPQQGGAQKKKNEDNVRRVLTY